MGRYQAHLMGGIPPRETVWAAIRLQRTFTVDDLADALGLSRGLVHDYVLSLTKAGILARSGSQRNPSGGGFVRAEYTLVQDLGLEAPRVRKNGTLIPASGRQRMWRTMGILKDFSLRDLVATASLPEAPIARAEAEYYCEWLVKGHYLRAAAGRYCIVPVMRHGPRAPMIQRVRRLLDPNTGEIVCESHAVEEQSR